MKENYDNDSSPNIKLIKGVAHSQENYSNYKCLIKVSSLFNLTNEEILSKMKMKHIKKMLPRRAIDDKSTKYWNPLKNIDKGVKDIVVDRISNGWSIKSISSCFGMDSVTIKTILKDSREKAINAIAEASELKHLFNIKKEHIVATEFYLKKNKTK